ncbi:MAG: hypothetical protein QM831_37145 [Kofleriaceae bacterium]
MGYRDDVDTLYQRSLILQKELDQAQERLAERERELEHLRGPFAKHDTSPGIRQLRELPPAETLLSRLVDTISKPFRDDKPFTDGPFADRPPPPPIPQPPPPAWLDEAHRRAMVLEQSRERLDHLDDETLILIGALVEELATESATRTLLLDSLRPMVEAITRTHAIRKSGRP